MKRLVVTMTMAMGLAAAFAAGELDEAVLYGETDKARAIDYAPGRITASGSSEKMIEYGL